MQTDLFEIFRFIEEGVHFTSHCLSSHENIASTITLPVLEYFKHVGFCTKHASLQLPLLRIRQSDNGYDDLTNSQEVAVFRWLSR